MAVHLFPSSYRCDCGHESDFFENTIKEISAMSRKRKQHLADSTEDEHTIEFSGGEAVAVLCPRLGRRKICDGINGTLLNYGLLPVVFSVEALERIGAVERARILKQAVESFGDQEQIGQLTKRFRPHMITPEQKKLFGKLDTRYYHVNENFSELAAAYIKKHDADFRSYQMGNPLAQGSAAPNHGSGTLLGSSGVSVS